MGKNTREEDCEAPDTFEDTDLRRRKKMPGLFHTVRHLRLWSLPHCSKSLTIPLMDLVSL